MTKASELFELMQEFIDETAPETETAPVRFTDRAREIITEAAAFGRQHCVGEIGLSDERKDYLGTPEAPEKIYWYMLSQAVEAKSATATLIYTLLGMVLLDVSLRNQTKEEPQP